MFIQEALIGKGAPNKAGTAGVHGAALGSEEMAAFRKNIGLPDSTFYKMPGVEEFFQLKQQLWQQKEEEWNSLFENWSKANPDLHAKWKKWQEPLTLTDLNAMPFPMYERGSSSATRTSSGAALQVLSKSYANLIGGSADLAPSNNTYISAESDFSAGNYAGRNLRFGVREHAMGAIANGMTLYGSLRVYAATFLVFSDYMRPAIRLSSLMSLPVVYVFTHDSVYIGEDGPTHQPVEHIAALRTIPGLHLLRPGDPEETNEAWKYAMLRQGPSALVLTRQKLAVYEKKQGWEEQFHRGAYTVFETENAANLSKTMPSNLKIIVATGSEVNLAIEVAKAYAESETGGVRVISIPCLEAFYQQDNKYRETLIPPTSPVIAVEAGIHQPWLGLAGSRKNILSIDRFGMSAPGALVAEELGFSSAKLFDMLKNA